MIRLHLYKVHRYKVLIEAYRNKEEVKLAPDNGGWSEEQRLEWVRDQLDTQFMGFRSHSYEDGFLAFLICSVPADFYSGRKISLPLLVPPEDASFEPIATAPKATRRTERASSSSVEGTASAALERSSGTSQGSSGEKGNSLNIVMTHNIQRGVQPGKRQLLDDTDEEIAGLLEESSSLKKLIEDIKELAHPSFESEISEHQLRIVEVILLYIDYCLDF